MTIHITPDVAAAALGSVVSLLGLWVLLYWCVREYRVDHFRANIFALRSELFDLAAAGEMTFDAPAYAMLRTTLNGFLRYADQVGVPLLLIANREVRNAGDAEQQIDAQWSAAIADATPALRAQLVDIRSRMHFEVFKQVVCSSPLIILTTIPFVVMAIVKLAGRQMVTSLAHRCYRAMESVFERFVGPLDATAYSAGARAAG